MNEPKCTCLKSPGGSIIWVQCPLCAAAPAMYAALECLRTLLFNVADITPTATADSLRRYVTQRVCWENGNKALAAARGEKP